MKTLEKNSDEALIKEVLLNNADAYGELYCRYQKKVYQKCLSLIKDPDDAFDLAEEALIKALNSLRSFRGDSAFSTWLYIITHRRCLEALRKKSKQNFIPLNGHEEYFHDLTEESGDKPEIEKIMLTLIEKLPESEKQLLLLKYSQGVSVESLQIMFHLSASAVKMRLKRSRERLNQLYLVATTIGLAEALAQLM
jgi:RNA polymerase sigma-70 factor (ECF subfamily)